VNNTGVFINSPVFLDLHSMLIRKLADEPKALSKVVEGLLELEANGSSARQMPPVIDAVAVEGNHAAIG